MCRDSPGPTYNPNATLTMRSPPQHSMSGSTSPSSFLSPPSPPLLYPRMHRAETIVARQTSSACHTKYNRSMSTTRCPLPPCFSHSPLPPPTPPPPHRLPIFTSVTRARLHVNQAFSEDAFRIRRRSLRKRSSAFISKGRARVPHSAAPRVSQVSFHPIRLSATTLVLVRWRNGS